MAVSQIDADGENAEYENTISVAGGPEVETGIAGRECQRLGLTRFYLALLRRIVRRYKDGSSRYRKEPSFNIGALISHLA